MPIVIDKGIPLPPRPPKDRLIDTLRAMNVGDSILLSDHSGKVGSYNQRLAPKHFIARVVANGVRIWRDS